MEDIRLAIGLIAFLSIAVFAAMIRLLRPCPKKYLNLIAVGILGLLVLYLRTVWGQLWIVNWIPLPSVIVLSNWFPPLLAALGATVWASLEPEIEDDVSEAERDEIASASMLRRVPVMLILVAAAVYSVMYFIPREAPECQDKWFPPRSPFPWPVCGQTTPKTCSAAAATTILTTLGIETTEQEMAKLCLTTSGTTWLGLYHGLSTKLLYTKHRVEFFEGDAATIGSFLTEQPLLLCCQLDAETAVAMPEYTTSGGWGVGTAHSVVYFGRVKDLHIIGDPSRGYELWPDKYLEDLWTGEGLRIVKRPGAAN